MNINNFNNKNDLNNFNDKNDLNNINNKFIEIENLTIYYGNEKKALDDISLNISKGDFVGIVGPNGSGKSTLLKAMLNLIPITYGTIKIDGHKVKNRKTVIGYVPQFSSMNTTFPITALEAVMTGMLGKGLHPFFYYKDIHRQKAMEKLKEVGIEFLANRQISDLSGGEFQKLLIARALVTNPEILIMDEPTSSIDQMSRKNIFEILEKINSKMTVILVSHDLSEILRLSNKILCLNTHLTYYGDSNITVEQLNSYTFK